MLSRVLAIALLGCSRGQETAPVALTCPTPLADAALEGPIADRLTAYLDSGQALLLGEHHGQVAEVALLLDLVGHLQMPTMVAMELLPASQQAELDALVSADTFSHKAWMGVVGDRYWPAPLHVSEYEDVARAVWSRRQDGVDVRLVGLAPDCRLPPSPSASDRSTALTCFGDRDASMLTILRGARATHPDHALVVSAGWRHVSKVRLPSAPKALGELWPRHWPATRVLLSAPERALDTGGWVSTCGSGPTELASAHRKPISIALSVPPGAALQLGDCVDLPKPDGRPLHEAFDLLVGLAKGTAPTPLDEDDFALVDPEDRAAWARTRTVLMGHDSAPSTPAGWAAWAHEDVSVLSAQLQSAPGCHDALP